MFLFLTKFVFQNAYLAFLFERHCDTFIHETRYCFFHDCCMWLFNLDSTQSIFLYVMPLNLPQCLVRERPLRNYIKSHAHCHILVYFYCLYFYCQEKCCSGNKTITSFPVAAILAFCTSHCKNYRAPGSASSLPDSLLGNSINQSAQGRDPVTPDPPFPTVLSSTSLQNPVGFTSKIHLEFFLFYSLHQNHTYSLLRVQL